MKIILTVIARSGRQEEIKFKGTNPEIKANKWIEKNIFHCDVEKLIKETAHSKKMGVEWWILKTI